MTPIAMQSQMNGRHISMMWRWWKSKETWRIVATIEFITGVGKNEYAHHYALEIDDSKGIRRMRLLSESSPDHLRHLKGMHKGIAKCRVYWEVHGIIPDIADRVNMKPKLSVVPFRPAS